MSVAPGESEDTCTRIASCELRVTAEAWPFAKDHADAIAAHWRRATAERPKFFNGAVYMLREGVLAGDRFRGTFLRTDFKSFLYWRESGYPDLSVRDGFGSAVIRSAEGCVLLGRQASGNVNGGLAYPPGGFIDERDVHDGAIDIDASIARELVEETGLDPARLTRTPGYLLTRAGPFVSIGIEWRSGLGAEELRGLILAHVAGQPVPELADVVIVRSPREIDAVTMPRHAAAILRLLLSA
jgi:hypothetical protein